MGYGQCAVQQLFSYFKKRSDIDDQCEKLKDDKHTLLLHLDELKANNIDYVGASYGLTLQLMRYFSQKFSEISFLL